MRTLPNLTEVVETKNIVKTADGAEADGKVIDVNSLVSMNMWGLTPDFLDVLEEGFKEFFEKEVPGNPLKAEYLIPIFIGELLEQGKMSVKVLKTNDIFNSLVEESHRSFCYHIVSSRDKPTEPKRKHLSAVPRTNKKISKPDSRAGEGYHKRSDSTAELFAGAGGLNMGSF